MGTAVIERFPVWSPEGEYLQLIRSILDVGHLVLRHVIRDEVTFRVKDLYLVRIHQIEALVGRIGRVDDERQPRVPCGIDAGREDGVVLHVDFPDIPVVGDDGAAQVLTGMELHPLRTVVLIAVAVDALSLVLLGTQHIVVDDTFLIRLQTSLTDGQYLVADIGGGNQTVAQIGVDGIRRDMDIERLIAHPLSVVAGKDLHLEGFALCLVCQ